MPLNPKETEANNAPPAPSGGAVFLGYWQGGEMNICFAYIIVKNILSI